MLITAYYNCKIIIMHGNIIINAILPELHLVGLLYIIDLSCTETQI